MTETRCRYAGSDQPRVLVDRHRDDCAGDCRGCQPCDRAHCRICGVEHSAGACPGCLAAIRDDLGEIRRMVAALPAEVRHRGIDSEAMVLAGPVADPESWEHHAASALAGRIVPADCDARDLDDLRDWLDRAEGEHHPAWVLGTWEMVVRDHLGHETDAAFAVSAAIGYLDQQLTAVAADPLVPVEDMARDLRRCVAHMERVLHDGEQVDQSRVPCLKCGTRLVRIWGSSEARDHHVCRRCQRAYGQTDYLLARAQWLADEGAARYVHVSDAASAAGCPERTVRTWINRDQVSSMRDELTGRLLVWWPDVRHAATQSEIRRTQRKVG